MSPVRQEMAPAKAASPPLSLASRPRRRGRPAAPEAVALGRPVLAVPTGALALEVIELLAEMLQQEVTDHSVPTPSGCARSAKSAPDKVVAHG